VASQIKGEVAIFPNPLKEEPANWPGHSIGRTKFGDTGQI